MQYFEQAWTLVSLILTLLRVFITLAGSLWVMHHLEINMIPKHEMSAVP